MVRLTHRSLTSCASLHPHLRRSPKASAALLPSIRPVARSTSTAAAQGSLEYPDAAKAKHHDLPSFLDYARRTGLDTASTIYAGTHYEYTVASALERYGFHLRRVGGASDLGIDLVGSWAVPSVPEPLKVLVQCKALAKKISPNVVRELEGAFAGAPVGWRGNGVIGLLVTKQPATKGVRDSLGRTRWPMAFVACSPEGTVQQMLWNHRAEEEGLDGMGVALRHAADAASMPELVLTHGGIQLSAPPRNAHR